MSKKLSADAYEQLVSHSVDIQTVISDNGEIQYESASITDVLGYEPAELEGNSVFDYIHPDDRQTAFDAFYKTVEADEDYTATTVELRF